MAWKEQVGTPIVKLDENSKTIEGTLLSIDEGQYGPQFKIRKLDGSEVVLGNQTVLATKILPKLVGKKIKVEFIGKVKSAKSKQSYNDYKIYVDE